MISPSAILKCLLSALFANLDLKESVIYSLYILYAAFIVRPFVSLFILHQCGVPYTADTRQLIPVSATQFHQSQRHALQGCVQTTTGVVLKQQSEVKRIQSTSQLHFIQESFAQQPNSYFKLLSNRLDTPLTNCDFIMLKF